jgi:hypothetical protein
MPSTASETEKPTTKAAFILSLPTDLPASQAVEQAVAAGYVNTKAAHVHEIRSAARRGPRKRSKLDAKKKLSAIALRDGIDAELLDGVVTAVGARGRASVSRFPFPSLPGLRGTGAGTGARAERCPVF